MTARWRTSSLPCADSSSTKQLPTAVSYVRLPFTGRRTTMGSGGWISCRAIRNWCWLRGGPSTGTQSTKFSSNRRSSRISSPDWATRCSYRRRHTRAWCGTVVMTSWTSSQCAGLRGFSSLPRWMSSSMARLVKALFWCLVGIGITVPASSVTSKFGATAFFGKKAKGKYHFFFPQPISGTAHSTSITRVPASDRSTRTAASRLLKRLSSRRYCEASRHEPFGGRARVFSRGTRRASL